jgi:hypothetical protein
VQEKSRRLQGAALRGVRGIAEDLNGEDSEIQIERDGEECLIVTLLRPSGLKQQSSRFGEIQS